MAETLEAPVQTDTEKSQEQVAATQPSPFAGEAWSETPPAIKQENVSETTTATTEEKTTETKTEEQDETLDQKEWLKREFEIDDVAVLKAEREEYKKLKSQPKEELKFENEQSKQLHELIRQGKTKEVREYLETQERLNSLTTSEVSKDSAADIIKMGMQLKYKDLTSKEIEYKYNKEFSLPKEPVYDEAKETEDEFKNRHQEWEEKVSDIEMTKIIEAKLTRPLLEESKVKIVLPQIDKPEAKADEPNQELLDAQMKFAENFLNKLESDFSKVEGFTTKVKDESVELPITFKIPDEDKAAIKGRLEKGLDIDKYISARWFDESGNPKIEQMISDIYEMENREKVHSGIANNAATKRLAAYRKQTSNINVDATKTSQQTFQVEQNGKQISPFSSDAWSETPPALQTN